MITRRTSIKGFATWTLSACLGLSVFGAAHIARAGEPSVDEILRKADEVRNPSESFFLRVVVKTPGSADSEFEVSVKGNSKTLINTLKPERDKNRKMLMLNEDMYAYLPNLKRPVRVSLNQKLVGQTANGDISRMRWTGDYTPTLESQTDKEWALFLSSKKKGLTYDKVRVWVDKGTFRPSRAEFLTPAGKVLKRAIYRDYKELAGQIRPGEIYIKDATSESASTIIVREMAVKNFVDSKFTPESLAQ